MDISTATRGLSALAQESRLETFRMLVRSGPEGMAAGEIASRLDIPHNTLSTHLSILLNAQLLNSRREGRSIIYSINFEGTRSLLAFLMEDCCQGNPKVVAPLISGVLKSCCKPQN